MDRDVRRLFLRRLAAVNGNSGSGGYGARMVGSLSNAVNLILRFFLYHFLHIMSL